MPEYDAIVIGTGQAGPALAFRLAGAGMKVAIAERKLVGGTCVNTGCTPTKTLVASAYAAHMARRAADTASSIGGEVGVDMKRVKARKDAVVAQSRDGLTAALESAAKLHALPGPCAFLVGARSRDRAGAAQAERIFINVGGRAVVPAWPGIDEVPYLTNSSMMEVDFLPRHLVIVGGSYVGLEFAQMYRRFGSAVTVIEMAPRLIPREDEDLSAAVQAIVEREGIAVRLDAECISLAKRGDDIVATRRAAPRANPRSPARICCSRSAAGPTPTISASTGPGCAATSAATSTVDDELRTNVPGIWALGDCNGKGAFTHTAYNDYEIVAANLLDNDPRRVSDRITAYALYIDPPLGRAGMTVAEARASGRRVLVGAAPDDPGRAAPSKRARPRALCASWSTPIRKEILGAAILGPGGDEAIHCILDLMYAKAPYPVLQRAMHIHPTVSELMPTMLGELQPLA